MYDFRLKQSLGQNLLRDKNVAKKIVNSIDIENNSNVIEIGPGDGAITGLLLEKFKRVIAVEIDKKFIRVLKEKYSDYNNFIILCDDFLKIDIKDFFNRYGNLNIIGNLPYHITSPVLFKLFENKECINRAYLMVQREVGDRIISPCRTKSRGILSVFSQYYCNVKALSRISKNVFYPVPKVDSSFLRFDFTKEKIFEVNNEELFRKVVKLTFGKRRKYLKNTLCEIEKLETKSLSEEFNLNKRPEELTVQEFVKLTNLIYRKIT